MDNLIFRNFQEAGQSVLAYLHQRFGFDLWMITRAEGENWIVLQSEDHGYNVQPGQVFRWADSFCSHMVLGKAPRIAPRSEDIALYATAPINQQVSIRSYIGQPLINEDGSLFGTLCAIDPSPKSESIIEDAEMLDLFGILLSKILQADLRQNEQLRLHERLQAEASSDMVTGLYNRRAWERLLLKEEERCKRYGLPAAIFFIDINDLKKVNDNLGHVAGDHIIQEVANVLRNNLRSNDIVARLGGDEFVILSIESNREDAEKLLERIMAAFTNTQISVAIGFAVRHPSQDLAKVAVEADKKMYEHKRQIKANSD